MNVKASLFLAAGAGLLIGIMGINGFKRVRLGRAVDRLINENPDLF